MRPFPPGGIKGYSSNSKTGSNCLSAHVLILPYLEQGLVSDEIDPTAGITWGYLKIAEGVQIDCYICPSSSVHFKMALGAANGNDTSFGSHHPGGANFLMADASARFLSDNIPLTMLKAHATRAWGETPDIEQRE